MSKKDRAKSKSESSELIESTEKEVILSSVKNETGDEILEVLDRLEVETEQEVNKLYVKPEIKIKITDEDSSSVAFDEITYIESNEDKLNEPIKIKKIEYDYALDEIEAYINNATKVGNHYLASELHKVSAILSDLNHTFTHLSGEAKLFISIILKNGKILKC